MSNATDIEDDIVKTTDRRTKAFRDAARPQEPLRAEPRAALPRYDEAAELARAEAFAAAQQAAGQEWATQFHRRRARRGLRHH